MATFLNTQKSSSSAPRGADMARPRNKFLPSIFEEKNDDKIQDFRKTLKITEDEDVDVDLEVRSGMHEGEGADEKSVREELPTRGGRASTAGKFKSLVRSLSETRFENGSWRSKRQGSAFVGRKRVNSGIPSGNRSFGYGQRKITSPGVNRGRAVDMPEVIDLTNPEEAKNIARRFFEDELKMDLADPRFNKPEDFIASLRWKAERKFSYSELWHRRRSSIHASSLIKNPEIFQLNANTVNNKLAKLNNQEELFEKLPQFSQLESKYFQVAYSKPKTGGNGNSHGRKKLTSSFREQTEAAGPKRRQGRILNPIPRDAKKSKNALRLRGQSQVNGLKQT